MEQELVSYDFFTGKHKLGGTDYGLLIIDGETYEMIEDENDGYRSSLKGFSKSNQKCTNQFQPIDVFGSIEEGGEIVCFRDMENGKKVLTIGTDWTDGYYPLVVFEWTPENLHVNELKDNK